MPIGWKNKAGDPRRFPHGVGSIALKLVGLLVTAFAISLGAPFWFDIVGRGVSLRSSGSKPAPSGGTGT